MSTIDVYTRERFNGTYGQYDKDGFMPTGQVEGRIEVKK
jgi:hypothetical protein